MECSWPDLQAELLSRIVSKSTNAVGRYASLRRVCKSWRRSLIDHSPVPPLPFPQVPFLLLPPRITSLLSLLDRVFCFASLLRQAITFLPQLRNTHGRICVGSSHGWIITLGADSSVSLLNPVTADSITLPPLSSIDNAILIFNPCNSQKYHLTQEAISHSQFSIVHRAVLSSDPAVDRNFIVLMFLSGLTDCCFTWRDRGDTWSRHVHPPFLVEDVVFCTRYFVTIDRSTTLRTFDFRNCQTGLVVKIIGHIWKNVTVGEAFLVNSDIYLFIVTKSFGHLNFFNPRYLPGGYIKVYAFPIPVDENDNVYAFPVPVEERGRVRYKAFFVGHGCSVCVSSQDFPWLMGNTVYFTHVYSMLEELEGPGERALLHQGAVYFTIGINSVLEPFNIYDVEDSQCADFWVGL